MTTQLANQAVLKDKSLDEIIAHRILILEI